MPAASPRCSSPRRTCRCSSCSGSITWKRLSAAAPSAFAWTGFRPSRSARRQPVLGARDPARLRERAHRVLARGRPEPLILARVELDALAPEDLAHDLVALEVHDREPVGPARPIDYPTTMRIVL